MLRQRLGGGAMSDRDDDHILRELKSGDGLPKANLTPKELAEFWCMADHTLANWRHQGIGPKFTKVGARILYKVEDVIAYEKTHNPADKDS
ncbi:MAG: hypothetical protein CL844_04970 [Crocinitomicaceae bacterium]|nr:hypothetical protein [Crocinitomicaceae bacterium]